MVCLSRLFAITKRVAAVFGVCAVLTALLVIFPVQAQAKYTEVSSQYPAAQDLTEVAREGLASLGKSIYPYVVSPSDITDGTYTVPAYTSSRMCNFYASSADAASKSNPNQVLLTVSGGTVTATFYMSGAYNAVYFGSAEQAAALAPADGLTPSPSYLVDDNDSYDAGHGPFSVQLGSLNTEFSFAVYNGGTKGIEGGLWYNRLGSVIVTTDFAEAYVIGASPDPEPTPDPNPEPTPTPDGSGDGGTGDGDATSGGENNINTAGTNNTNTANQNGVQETQNEQASSDSAIANTQTVTAGTTMLGKRLTIVNASDTGQGSSQTVLDGTMISLDGITPGQIAAISAVLVVLAGMVAFAVRFLVQLKGKPSP